ncbi:MAG: HAD family hydrolase [Acidobacteria bacterium]|nr:MAG: HAD family hydrolase [Acidobacteriota bacterium]
MIEIVRTFPRCPIRSVLFDFDGTLSLIREGWQEVMISFMTEILHQLDPDAAAADLRTHVNEYVTRLTGKQTIYQMIQLAEEVRMRGGAPEDPLVYKHRYHDRLWQRIQERIEGLESGRYPPDDWLVPGSMGLLDNLRDRDIRMFLASGTDEVFVKREADLLGLTPHFNGHIYGAQDQYRLFSKKMVIRRVLSEENLKGSEFVAFGDGYVEIENTKEVGGVAVGVATEERLRSGAIDEWKRERLIAAGADVIIPDFGEQERLVAYLAGETD